MIMLICRSDEVRTTDTDAIFSCYLVDFLNETELFRTQILWRRCETLTISLWEYEKIYMLENKIIVVQMCHDVSSQDHVSAQDRQNSSLANGS